MFDDKPVCIVLQGPSVKDLEKNIYKFKGLDVYWASLNRFAMIENNVLSKIDKHLDIVYCASMERFDEYWKQISEFVARDNKLFITSSERYLNNLSILDKVKSVHLSDYAYGFSSLFALLCALINSGAKDIYIFGADGKRHAHHTYYKQNLISDDFDARANSILKDTLIMNRCFYMLCDYWGVEARKINIINCTPGSAIDCFQIITINSFINRFV